MKDRLLNKPPNNALRQCSAVYLYMYVWKKIQKTKSPANLRLQGFVAEKEGFEPSMCY